MPAFGENHMGYNRKRKVYRLDFSETEYDGLEVRLYGLTTGEYLELVTLTGANDGDGNETEKLLRLFATHLVSWNLQEDGEPVPATEEGVKANDLQMNMTIIDAWTDAMVKVPRDTEKKSLAGDPSLVASIPTESLSASL
jgi:hypothetical protein